MLMTDSVNKKPKFVKSVWRGVWLMYKVMTDAAVVFQDLSSDRDETESERWSMREREPSSEECK